MDYEYEIGKIETLENSTHLYLQVDFYNGARLIHRNDFVMQIAATHTRYTGPMEIPPDFPFTPLPDPDPDPRYWLTTDTDVPAEIIANIERYGLRLERRQNVPPDSRDARIRSDTADPLGLLARPGVSDLVGQRRTPPAP
jgi:hypothetical protein